MQNGRSVFVSDVSGAMQMVDGVKLAALKGA